MGKQVAAGHTWGCSSVGRAPALQAGGQEFESLHLHSSKDVSLAVMPAHLSKCVAMTVKQSETKVNRNVTWSKFHCRRQFRMNLRLYMRPKVECTLKTEYRI